MDLLASPPDNPATPHELAPYVCHTEWDGLSFFEYAHRNDLLHTIPSNLSRFTGGSLPESDRAWQFQELLYPTPKEDRQAFLQTWLFFGLLAEFLGLNETVTGDRIVDEKSANEERDDLYQRLVYENDGRKYLTGARLIDPEFSLSTRIVHRIKLAGPDIPDRITHLHRCLTFARFMLSDSANNHSQADFDRTVRYSMAALGELLSAIMWTAIHCGELPKSSPVFALGWQTKYIDPGSSLERKMLRNGWCPSEIEKIRNSYQGLGTLHYLSRMNKENQSQRHSHCSRDSCIAFQIVKGAYRTLHAANGCSCSDVCVDIEAVENILEHTNTFPVLSVKAPRGDVSGEGLQMTVDPYEDGLPYVAISHVWADGMGNPTDNALPRCQIAKIARLIEDMGELAPSSTGSHRIWIDTLLCPIDEHFNKASLNRIADVYRKATYVLVLDASIMSYRADELNVVQVLLRSFACSSWMRRLWTLQEGALAKKVYFQFADRAVDVQEQLKMLRSEFLCDPRLVSIFTDITSEVLQVRGWSNGIISPSFTLFSLQKALHFRTVSQPSDEPLCITTLLSLDMERVSSTTDGQERMRRVWELIAAKYGVPLRIIFSSDEGLSIAGWRWAPKSLLAVSFSSEDSVMDWNSRLSRFSVKDASGNPQLGIPSPRNLGLRVVLPGCLLRPVPRVPDRLNPWAGMTKSREDEVLVRLESTHKWVKLADFYRSKKLEVWTDEERCAYDDNADRPLCRSIQTGKCAVLYNPDFGTPGVHMCIMAQVEAVEREDSHDGGARLPLGEARPLRAQKERRILVREANSSETLIANTMQELADKVARHAVNDELQKIDKATHGPEYSRALDKVRELMKELTAEAWRSKPDFVQAVHDSIGPDMAEYMWAHIPMYFSHDVSGESVPPSQVWFVD